MIYFSLYTSFSSLCRRRILSLQFRTEAATASRTRHGNAVADVLRLERRLCLDIINDGLRSLKITLDLRFRIDGRVAINLRITTTHGNFSSIELYQSLAFVLLNLQRLVGKGTNLFAHSLQFLALDIFRHGTHVHLL